MDNSEITSKIKSEIDAQMADISKLPAMPAIVQRAIKLAGDPDVDFKALADEISRDPSITANIIKLSNSTYYSPSRQIRSVHEAIVTLGLDVVKDIIMVSVSKGVLKVPLEGYRVEGAAMWDHSLLVADLAARIATLKKTKTKSDVAFTAGLLHDVGKVLLVHYFRRVWRLVQAEMEKNPESRFSAVEKQILGYSHNEMGARLLKSWQFPNDLIEAVWRQYQPEKAKINPELASMVHVANTIALASGVGVDIGGLHESISPFAIETLKLSDNDIESLYTNLPEILEKLNDMRTL